MKKIIFLSSICLLFLQKSFSQTVLDKNSIASEKWMKDNEAFLKPLTLSEFNITNWPVASSVTLPANVSSFAEVKPFLIENLKLINNTSITTIKSDTAELNKTLSGTEDQLKTLQESIDKMKKESTGLSAKDSLLMASFIDYINTEKKLITANKKKLEESDLFELKFQLRTLESARPDTISTLASYKAVDGIIKTTAGEAVKVRESIKKTIELINSSIQAINNKIQAYYKTIPAASSNDGKELSVLPSLNAKLGKRELLPNISLIGSATLGDNGRTFGNIKLFTGAGGNPKNLVTLENLLFEEFSSFGFISNFSYGFLSDNDKKTKMAVNFGINYLGKNLQKEDTADFNTSVFHFKIGPELAIDPKRLSLYINFNWLTVADNVATFEKKFVIPNKLFRFTDCGARFKLNMLNNQSTFLDVDLGFIINSNDAKLITKTNDLVIPRIKIGITQKITK